MHGFQLSRVCVLPIVFFLAIVTLPSEARSQGSNLPSTADLSVRWAKLGDNGFAVVYLDTTRVTHVDADRSEVWLFLNLDIPSHAGGDVFDRTVDHVRVNCSTLVVEGMYSTTRYRSDGVPVGKIGGDELNPIPAATNTRPMAEAVCLALRR